jgi:hypothetical protein
MKSNFSLSITKPCSEKWSSFTPTSGGGFCSSCSQTVIDFTAMTDDEILNFFANKPSHTCGRFRPNQLRDYSATLPTTKLPHQLTLLKAGVVGLMLMLMSRPASAETDTRSAMLGLVNTESISYKNKLVINPDVFFGKVSGVVKDEFGEVLPGVNVILKGTTVGTVTDSEGRYELKGEISAGDVIVFAFIGLETQEFVVPKTFSGELNMVMITMDMTVMGEVAIAGPYEPQPSGLRKWWKKMMAWL